MKYTCKQCDITFTKNEGADPICPICGRNVARAEAEAKRGALDSAITEELELDWSALGNCIPSVRELPNRLSKTLRGADENAPFQLRYGNVTDQDGTTHKAAALLTHDTTCVRIGLYLNCKLAMKMTCRKGTLPTKIDAALAELGWFDLLTGEVLHLTSREVYLADCEDSVTTLTPTYYALLN